MIGRTARPARVRRSRGRGSSRGAHPVFFHALPPCCPPRSSEKSRSHPPRLPILAAKLDPLRTTSARATKCRRRDKVRVRRDANRLGRAGRDDGRSSNLEHPRGSIRRRGGGWSRRFGAGTYGGGRRGPRGGPANRRRMHHPVQSCRAARGSQPGGTGEPGQSDSSHPFRPVAEPVWRGGL